MKQRIFSLLLVFAMVLGMLPTVALAEDSIDTVNIAAFGTVTLDGNLNEKDWLTYGCLTNGTAQRAFGTLWDSQNLYFAVVPEADDQKLTLKVNGKTLDIDLSTLTLSGALAETTTVKKDSALEIQLPFSALEMTVSDYNQTVSAELAVDDMTWSGDVLLSATERTCTPTFSAYAGVSGGDAANLGCTVDNGSYRGKWKTI